MIEYHTALSAHPTGWLPTHYQNKLNHTYHTFVTGERRISTNNVARNRLLFCELPLAEQMWFARHFPTPDVLEAPDAERRLQMALSGDFGYFRYKGWVVGLSTGIPLESAQIGAKMHKLFEGWDLAWTAPRGNPYGVELILATPMDDMTSVVVGNVRHG